MDSQVGGEGYVVRDSGLNANSGYIEFEKVSEMNDPSSIWIFCDESFWTMNDGWLEMDLVVPAFPDCPAAYNCQGNCFNMADGHAEYRRWVGPYQISATNPHGILGVVYQFGIVRAGSTYVASSGTDDDWRWLYAHTAQKGTSSAN